ncbi:MAG: hypothetical protein BZY73_03730 [SAR202 cluster bacterium Casp-Chloro-G3]|nr:MAG: hypothetical protein BZY73_03730 [SAR202 cluster bacterium Casp-Chloro-G3]
MVGEGIIPQLNLVERILPPTYNAAMEWLLGIFAWLGAVAALLTIGEFLDRWLKESTKVQLTNNLAMLVTSNATNWLRTTNRMFLAAFGRVYGGNERLWEQAIWTGLLASPLIVAATQQIVVLNGTGSTDTTRTLAVALGLTGVLALLGLISIPAFRDSDFSVKEAVGGGILGGILGGIFGILGVGILGGIGGAIFGGIGAIGSGIGIIRIPISPWKALVSSLIVLLVASIIFNEAGWAFWRAIQANPWVLTFVAFNVFADGVSLWETRWVLEKGATARVPKLVGLLVLDFVLSGVIYLVLPLALWPQILEFWDAWQFKGEQPWLGLLFWTTFSTSFLFYGFVLAALLVRPLRAAAVGLGVVGNWFGLEEHPVRCLSVAMALVVTLIFGGVGAWEIISGFGAAPVAAVP